MDDREEQRKIRHRLAVLGHVEEVSGNVAATCRWVGISRTVLCRWKTGSTSWVPRGWGIAARGPVTQPDCRQGRGGQADRGSAPALPLRPRTHRDVPQVLPRRRDLPLGGVQGWPPAGSGPAAGEPALAAPHPAPEAVRPAAPGASSADRREARSPHRRRHGQAALPVQRHRGLHPAARAAHLPQRRPAHRHWVPRLGH